MAKAPHRIAGIDIGGTFTDLLLYEQDGARACVHAAKIPTTAANQAEGVLAALAATGSDPATIDLIIHGTTATTNAPTSPSSVAMIPPARQRILHHLVSTARGPAQSQTSEPEKERPGD